jgi:environmental stress-induced protein Ves
MNDSGLSAAIGESTRVDARTVAPTPWRNGGGVTRELLRIPARGPATADDDWLLRISLADITADGAFSAFDGITRWFSVISGAGVRLTWPTVERTAGPGDAPFEFDGADAPFCHLLDGSTRDLNVMVRRDLASAQLLHARMDAPWTWPGAARGAFTLRPLILRRAGASADTLLELPAHALVWDDRADTAAWSIAALPGCAPAMPQTEATMPDSAGPAPAALWIGLSLNAAFREP